LHRSVQKWFTMKRTTIITLTVALLTAPTIAQADHAEMTPTLVESFDGTLIDINVCRPPGADAQNPVPVVLQSHGWGGKKSDCSGRHEYFNAGIGFVSMTQRGNTGSGGENNIMDPDFEGRDIMAVLDHIASLDWVAKDDGPGGIDPIVGGLGGSYGGGFQWVGALTDQYRRNAPTRFNSLMPGNTWHSLRTSLAPNGVMRTVIVSGLYAAGVQSNNLAPWVHVAMASATATGQLVDGPAPLNFASEFHQHGAVWFAEQGIKLDIPVYISQGAGDLVFNLNEGLDNLHHAVTPQAQAKSIFINHQAGHGLPGNIPSGPVPYADRHGETCDAPSPIQWFKHTLLGEPLEIGPRYKLMTVDKRCIELEELPDTTDITPPELDGALLPLAARGPATFYPIAEGPIDLAGAPVLSFNATTSTPDARTFWGLAVGTSPEDALLIGGQWMPTRLALPAVAERITTELGGVVAEVDEGETLFLVSAPAADQYAAHPSRVPGAMLVENPVLSLPII
jgi:ABC-2 type transport system ATP-binding protein